MIKRKGAKGGEERSEQRNTEKNKRDYGRERKEKEENMLKKKMNGKEKREGE